MHFCSYHTPESYHSGLLRFGLPNIQFNTGARKLQTTGQIQPITCFRKLDFIATQPYSFIVILSIAGFVL